MAQAAALEIASLLDSSNLDALLSLYDSEDIDSSAIELHLGLIAPRSADLIRLFLLNRQISRSALDELLSKDAQRRLGAMLHLEADQAHLNGFRLVFHNGAWIFCHSKRIDAYAYHGPDSLALARVIRRCRGSILDMCAGVGAQGISVALTGAHVVCAEVNPHCKDLFWLNAEINGVVDRVRFEASTPDELTGQFDWIICNPPLIPVPTGLEFPFVGNGGPDGLAVIKALLRNAPRLLRKRGKIRFVGTMLGSDAGPNMSELDEIAKQSRLSLDIVIPCRVTLEPGEPMFEALVRTAVMSGASEQQARKAYSSHFGGTPYLYSMVGTGSGCDGSAGLNVTRHFLLNRSFWHL